MYGTTNIKDNVISENLSINIKCKIPGAKSLVGLNFDKTLPEYTYIIHTLVSCAVSWTGFNSP
jgi:hypothetical protein